MTDQPDSMAESMAEQIARREVPPIDAMLQCGEPTFTWCEDTFEIMRFAWARGWGLVFDGNRRYSFEKPGARLTVFNARSVLTLGLFCLEAKIPEEHSGDLVKSTRFCIASADHAIDELLKMKPPARRK